MFCVCGGDSASVMGSVLANGFLRALLRSACYQRFVYGSQTMEILSMVEPNRHELYRASASSSEDELAFAATFTHQLEVRELEEDTKDESLLALQDTYRRINQEKEAST